jgi:hypothetical protein
MFCGGFQTLHFFPLLADCIRRAREEAFSNFVAELIASSKRILISDNERIGTKRNPLLGKANNKIVTEKYTNIGLARSHIKRNFKSVRVNFQAMFLFVKIPI